MSTTPEQVAAAFAAISGDSVNPNQVRRLAGNASVPTWRVSTPSASYAVRLYPAAAAPAVATQVRLLTHLSAQGYPVPQVVYRGTFRAHELLAVTWAAGVPLGEALQRWLERAAQLGHAFGVVHATLHALPVSAELSATLENTKPAATGQTALLHLDYHPLNVLTDGQTLTGVIDWDNARLGDPRLDVARTLSILSVNPDLLELPHHFKKPLRTFRRAYCRGYARTAGDEALAELAAPLAWAGAYMHRDLARRYTPQALERVTRWSRFWQRGDKLGQQAAAARPSGYTDAMHYTLDRFEDAGLAVLEDDDGTSLQVARAELPEGVREGDVLVRLPWTRWTGALRYAADPDETAARRRETETLRASLPRADEGDIDL